MRTWLSAASLLAALAAGCGHTEPPQPRIPVVRLDFETHLTVATECEYVGQIVGRNAFTDAEHRGANLILEFVIQTTTTTYNGVSTSSKGFKAGTALKCPPETVQRLLASAQRPPS